MSTEQRDEVMTCSRVLPGARDIVLRSVLEPGHLTHLWPAGMHTHLDGITVDARPGGAFETLMVADSGDGSCTMRAVYDEIVEPERISCTEVDSGMHSIATFVHLGDGCTEVTVEQRNGPAHFREPQARAGYATSLDRFTAYLIDLA